MLEDHYTNGLGQRVQIDQREDLELNKVKLEFRGWLLDPRFNYVLYTWTNNAAQGLGAQVVVGGNLNWVFGRGLTLGGGILSLPTTRSTSGSELLRIFDQGRKKVRAWEAAHVR